jgi:butyrate response factor 1
VYHREPANALYKTELCRTWEETGSCRYGGKCQFAHGRDELRPVMRHPKYKTEVCRTFSTSGSCPYGTRCRFIHYRVPTRSVCGTLIAQAHNVIPTDWSPEMSSRDVGARGGFHGRFHGDWNAGAEIVPRDDTSDETSAREDGFRRAASPLCGRRLPVFRDLAALSAERREESDGETRIAGAERTSSSAGVSCEGKTRECDFSAEPFPFAFVAERRASASAAASAVRRGAPPCASGPYDIGASVLFGNV